MKIYLKYDLPCHEVVKLKNGHDFFKRYYLMGYMDYTLSNVKFDEGCVFFELRDDEGLIGKYMVICDNWERIVETENTLETA